MEQNHSHANSAHGNESHHHILPYPTIGIIGACLLTLTALTVAVAHIDLGPLNLVAAMVIATAKALLVAVFFMNLRYDRAENSVIFGTAFVFLAIFMVFTSTDLFFRGDVYVKPGELARSAGPSKLKDPWVPTPELIAHGKELFQQNCVMCHGPEGKGDGPAGAALTPHPRNFTSNADWVNGRTVTGVFKTLREGVPGSGMASFATLPVDDRWALLQFVLSLGPTKVPVPTVAELTKAGISTTGVEKKAPEIPVDFAIERMVSEAGGR